MFTTIAIVLAATLQLPAQQSDATIGFAAIDLQTGRRLAVRGAERFPMGSVYKFPIALTLLRRVDAGTVSLDEAIRIEPKDFAPGWSPLRDEAGGKAVTLTVRDLLERMVSISDNTASDALLKRTGGPVAVTTRLAELGAAPIRVDRSEKQIHDDLERLGGVAAYARDARDSATPEAMADLFALFWKKQDGLSRESHDLLLSHLVKSPTGAKKLRRGAPAGWTVAHKSGMMPATSNDAGLLISPDGTTQIAIAIFAKGATSDYDTIDGDIAAIAKAVIDELTRKRE